MTDYITISDKKYPIRELRLTEYEVDVRISDEALYSTVFDEDGNYTSRDAQLIDELIFFYVPDELIEGTDEDIEEYIYDHLEW